MQRRIAQASYGVVLIKPDSTLVYVCRVKWSDPVTAQLSSNFTLYSVPPPGSGLLLSFILRLLDGFVTQAPGEPQVVQRITEAFKHAYGHRSDFGDPEFADIIEVNVIIINV